MARCDAVLEAGSRADQHERVIDTSIATSPARKREIEGEGERERESEKRCRRTRLCHGKTVDQATT